MKSAEHMDGPAPAAAPTSAPRPFAVQDRRFWVDDAAGPAASDVAPPPRYPAYVEQLRAELEAAQRVAAEKDARLKEYAATFQEQLDQARGEVQERLARDAEKRLARARGELATGLLEVLDNLQRSLHAAEQSRSVDALLAGLRQVETQFVARLEALGLEHIPAAGERFDPAVHEAVGVVPAAGDADDGRVVAEVQMGFRGDGGVVRPARVLVAKRGA